MGTITINSSLYKLRVFVSSLKMTSLEIHGEGMVYPCLL